MNYAIIAAGAGERLKSEGFDSPKPLVRVNGVPLIERLLKICIANGAASISCIINEEAEELHEYLNNFNFPVKFNLIVKTTLSSLHSLNELGRFLKGSPFMLMTTDSVFTEDEFRNYLLYINACNNYDGVLAVTKFIDDEKPLYAEVDKNGRIVSFADAGKNFDTVTGGIYYFKKDIFDVAREVIESKIFRLRNLLKKLAAGGYNKGAFELNKIIDVDHVSDVKKAEDLLNGEK